MTSSIGIRGRKRDIARIRAALLAANEIFRANPCNSVRVEIKGHDQPVTDAERSVNQLLLRMLVEDGEGWLSEENVDDRSRLGCSRVWVVDPLDGTREFIAGIPEWCVSIGLVEDGEVVAGGVLNPATQELFLGSLETGLVCLGSAREKPVASSGSRIVLASRSEFSRGEWERFRESRFALCPTGSVAYKLAMVAAGYAAATWTLVPKHEWDVAAGVGLVLAAGGSVLTTEGVAPTFNRPCPRFPGLAAFSAAGRKELLPFLIELSNEPAWRDCSNWARGMAATGV